MSAKVLSISFFLYVKIEQLIFQGIREQYRAIVGYSVNTIKLEFSSSNLKGSVKDFFLKVNFKGIIHS